MRAPRRQVICARADCGVPRDVLRRIADTSPTASVARLSSSPQTCGRHASTSFKTVRGYTIVAALCDELAAPSRGHHDRARLGARSARGEWTFLVSSRQGAAHPKMRHKEFERNQRLRLG